MFAHAFRCFRCGREYPMDSIFWCACGGALEITYDYGEIERVLLRDAFYRAAPTHWKYWAFYPIRDPSKAVTLGEGGTQLIRSRADENLLIKYEGTNPTGSFKDRGSTVEITKAVELGVKEVWCATTGNMGASAAAYATRAGLRLNVAFPQRIPKSKIAQAIAHGARIRKIAGNYDAAFEFVKELRKRKGVYLVGDFPFRGEGEKSIGYEIADQLHFLVPDWIVAPIGNGTCIYAIYKGLGEFAHLGLIEKVPKFAGVQAEGCAPVYNAWKSGAEEVKPIKRPKTIASAILVGNPIDGAKALFAIRKTRGVCEKVSDKEILLAQQELAKEGIYAEAGGAVAYAGYKKLKSERIIDGKIVVLVTGHGLKEK